MLNRIEALTAILEGHDDNLYVTGLGNATYDIAAITDSHPRAFLLDGAMGAAVSLALGVALARPERKVIVVTGDGELMMNGGALATVALQNPGNFTIIAVDNGVFGMTGGQPTATGSVADLETIAKGSGIRHTLTVRSEADFAAARGLLAITDSTAFIVIKVEPGTVSSDVIERDGVVLRDRFRNHVLETVGANK